MTIKVRMFPRVKDFHNDESGIKQVCINYEKHLQAYDIEFVDDRDSADLLAVHAGSTDNLNGKSVVCHTHGLYWSGDYDTTLWEYKANRNVINSIRNADVVTVPSSWVAETFKRDMRFIPEILPNGINWDEWQISNDLRHILGYAKNRNGVDVCNPDYLKTVCPMFPNMPFVATFANHEFGNLIVTGLQPFETIKQTISQSYLYLSLIKETGNITAMECMAAGVPVVGWRFGATVDVVTHGVDGYLARPGDYADLKQGVEWVLDNRDVLSANARENAKRFDWRHIIPKVAQVYHRAVEIAAEKPSVQIVIPVHNKPVEQLNRAIESALQQDKELVTAVTVVLDKCNDEYIKSYKLDAVRVEDFYYKVDFGNVAKVRNFGIDKMYSKYICCLDADDWIDPQFIRACVDALEADKTLGIAYTGLTTHLPDGRSMLSQWPGVFDANRQLDFTRRQNQIPTCCVFRREAWERVGGYRARYCPQGAGSEDAALWSAMILAGYGAKQATSAGLFHYSAFDGNVSGNSEYRELDWLAWYPAARDKVFPFACQTTPKNGFSHPVYQYDEPLLSIVIPVGEGHAKYIPDLLDSIEAQSFRGWEVIIVWDAISGNGAAKQKEIANELEISYPYARQIFSGDYQSHNPGRGAGYARNRGTELARAPFLLFIDADDMLNVDYPDALNNMLLKWQNTGNAIYSAHVARSYTSPEYAQQMQDKHKLLGFDAKDNETWIRQDAIRFDCAKAQRQPPESENPNDIYIWNLISTLIPKAWHDEIGGFDESMPTWEDWDYYLRMCKADHCFTAIDEPYIVYRYYSGTRRDLAHKRIGVNGRQLAVDVLQYITVKHKGIEAMGCSSCGNNKAVAKVDVSTARAQFSDDEFVLASYIALNTGKHRVVVSSTDAATGRVIKIDYGYHKGGGTEKFYVHRAHMANRHLFEAAPQRVAIPTSVMRDRVLPPPVAVTAQVEQVVKVEKPLDLQLIPGVTPAIASALQDAKLTDKAALIAAGTDGLIAIKGIGKQKAQTIIDYLEK